MARRMTGPEHLAAAADYLDEVAKAQREGDWAKVSALSAAAQAHAGYAQVALQVASAPSAVLAGKQGQQWLDAAAVERR